MYHHHHHHLIITYPLTARVIGAPQMISQPVFFHFSLFFTALWELANSRPVHSLTLSSHLFLCLPCLFPPFTVPCKMVLARLDEWETCPYHCSLCLFMMVRRSTYSHKQGKLTRRMNHGWIKYGLSSGIAKYKRSNSSEDILWTKSGQANRRTRDSNIPPINFSLGGGGIMRVSYLVGVFSPVNHYGLC